MLGANGSCLFLLPSNESLTYLKSYSLDQAVFDPDETSKDWSLLQRCSPTLRHRSSWDVSLVILCSGEWVFSNLGLHKKTNLSSTYWQIIFVDNCLFSCNAAFIFQSCWKISRWIFGLKSWYSSTVLCNLWHHYF